jgi:hypothetical protein
LDRYVKDGWVITAFKVDKSKGPIGTNVSTRALRMTFKTDKPFYPYREPEDMRTPGAPHSSRLLRVFVLATDRMEGRLGEGPGAANVGNTVWSDHIQQHQREDVLNLLQIKDSKLAFMPRLTVIEDTSSPRPGTEEMYLRTSPDQSTKKRPPIVTYVHVHAGGVPAGSPPSVEGLGFAATVAAGLSAVMLLVLVLWFYRASRGEVEG